MLITIDGPGGSGKTTLARRLSARLNIYYLDTGAMFRGIAFIIGENSLKMNKLELESKLKNIQFNLQKSGLETRILLNKQILGQEIRREKIGLLASELGTLKVVRDYLKSVQQDLGQKYSLVAEGRDMGTVVFPQADYKFFLYASVEIRSQRRYKQLIEQGHSDVNLQMIKKDLLQRDQQDETRIVAPLKQAQDAILIQTDNLNIDEVLRKIMSTIMPCHIHEQN